MTWSEIFIPSLYKARSSENSETQFSDAIITQRYNTRNDNTGNKKNRTLKKDTCKLHAKVVVIEHRMNQKEKITIFENTLRLHNEQFILPIMQ
jgi:hypothetical protein